MGWVGPTRPMFREHRGRAEPMRALGHPCRLRGGHTSGVDEQTASRPGASRGQAGAREGLGGVGGRLTCQSEWLRQPTVRPLDAAHQTPRCPMCATCPDVLVQPRPGSTGMCRTGTGCSLREGSLCTMWSLQNGVAICICSRDLCQTSMLCSWAKWTKEHSPTSPLIQTTCVLCAKRGCTRAIWRSRPCSWLQRGSGNGCTRRGHEATCMPNACGGLRSMRLTCQENRCAAAGCGD